jgi:hypothetical protein
VRIRRKLQEDGAQVDTYGEVSAFENHPAHTEGLTLACGGIWGEQQVAHLVLGRVGHGLVEGFLIFTQFGYCVGCTC